MKVKLSPKAEIFIDMKTGLKVTKHKEFTEVTAKQAKSPLFRKALNGGHLIEVAEGTKKKEEKVEKTTFEILSEMKKKSDMVKYLKENAEALDLAEEFIAELEGMDKTGILAEFEPEA